MQMHSVHGHHLSSGVDNNNMPAGDSTSIYPTAVPAPVTADDAVWLRSLQKLNGKLQENTSSTDGRHPQRSNPPPYRDKRIIFSGETLAHSILPNMDGHAEIPPSP